MAGIYSTRFLALANGTGTSSSFTVPESMVAIVRDLTVYQPATLDSSLLVALDAPYLVLYYGGAGGVADSGLRVRCRVVLNAGETLAASRASASAAAVACSGYLLGV